MSKEFNNYIKNCFNTTDGKKVLAYLKASYVDTTAKRSDPYETYYHLGQQDIVKLLIQTLNNPEEIDNIKVNLYDDQQPTHGGY